MTKQNLSTSAGGPEPGTALRKRPLSVRLSDWTRCRPIYQRWRGSRIRRIAERVGAFGRRNYFPLQILLILACRLSLDLLYITVISPLYAYSGFLLDLRPLPYACTLLALLVFAPFVARLQEDGSPSADIITILSYVYFIPLTSYCGCYYRGMSFFLLGMAYWAVLLFLQFHIPALTLKPLSAGHSRGIYLLFTIFSILLVLYVSGRYTGFRLTLNLSSVYGIRDEAAGYALPRMVSYALSMAGSVLAILLAYWLSHRKYVMCGALVLTYLFLFSISGLKSLFFFLLLVLAGYFFFHPWMRRWLPALLTPFVLLGVLEYLLVKSFYLAGYLFRRVMYTPVDLSARYMAYFQEHPLVLFRNSILRLFGFSSNYSLNIPSLIGEAAGTGSNACNGLLGDVFANLPALLGLFLLPLILIICFRLLDAAAWNLPEKLVISICVYFAMSFGNTTWSTVLLSHGFLITCLLLYFFPKEEESSP